MSLRALILVCLALLIAAIAVLLLRIGIRSGLDPPVALVLHFGVVLREERYLSARLEDRLDEKGRVVQLHYNRLMVVCGPGEVAGIKALVDNFNDVMNDLSTDIVTTVSPQVLQNILTTLCT